MTLSDIHSWSTKRPLTKKEWIEAMLVDLGKLPPHASGDDCPEPLPGFTLAFTYWDGQECWCVMTRIDPPEGWYEVPCL